LREYAWLDDLPLALVADVDTMSPNLYFVHADHLDRPLKMTDASQAIVWDAVYRPFGDVHSITGTAANNLRFPGQYFLIEAGLHYNWHRHYDPTIGRYLQADPLGFVDGPGIYPYGKSAPTVKIDAQGLSVMASLSTLIPMLDKTLNGLCETKDQNPNGAFQHVRGLPPAYFFEPPPVVRPPLPQFPRDMTKPPGPGWEWRGAPGSEPGGPNGNWYNPGTGESLHPDPFHPPPIGPHMDYKAPNGNWYRWYPNGNIELKM
jgi:RHS repeat-associated protein